MSIRLCDKVDNTCFEHFFSNVDSFDKERMKSHHPSNFICKAGDSIVGEGPYLHKIIDNTSFVTNSSIFEYATVLPMPACKTQGFCEIGNHKTACCPHHQCMDGQCQPILPQTLTQLNKRIEKLDQADKNKLSKYYSEENALNLLNNFHNVSPSEGIHNAMKSEELDMNILSKLRIDGVICKPNIVVDGIEWTDGPYTCTTKK